MNNQTEKIDEELLSLTLAAENFHVKNISFVNHDALIFQGAIELLTTKGEQILFLLSRNKRREFLF